MSKEKEKKFPRKESEKDLVLKRIKCWEKAGSELEHIRHKDIREADTAKAIKDLDGPFQSFVYHHSLRSSSGLIAQQQLFKQIVP